MNKLKEKIKSGKKLIGTHVTVGDACVTELLGYLPFDYIWVDMEHTQIDCKTLYGHLNAAKASGVSVIVRIPQHDYNTLKRVLEMGVDGIVFPMILDENQAMEDIKNSLYPPLGVRGFGPKRAVRYGLDDSAEYIESGSLDICRFIQIEHIDAVNSIDKIMEVPYIDGFIFGPCDLSGSIGELGRHYEKNTSDLVRETTRILAENGKCTGISIGGFDGDSIRHWSDMGIRMISVAGEMEFLLYGAQEALRNLQAVHLKGQ